uniref:Immunoglobulin subtype domain-containing protein n=2 Tax=Haplochromini TaxID=319058 RepID=A0A3B4H930_9CICH
MLWWDLREQCTNEYLQASTELIIPIRTGMEGGTITVGCSFTLSGSRKLFCKEKCEKGNILIETTDDSAQSGRYSIKYIEGFFLIHTVVYVSITELEKSDSGRYRCSLDRTPSDHLSLNWDFEVVVTEGEFLQKVTKTFMSLRIICVFSLSHIENNCVVRILVNFLCSLSVPISSLVLSSATLWKSVLSLCLVIPSVSPVIPLCLSGHSISWSLCLSLYHLSVFRPFVPPVSHVSMSVYFWFLC